MKKGIKFRQVWLILDLTGEIEDVSEQEKETENSNEIVYFFKTFLSLIYNSKDRN